MELICSSETSVHIQTAQCHVPEDGGVDNYLCENFKSYTSYNYSDDEFMFEKYFNDISNSHLLRIIRSSNSVTDMCMER